MMETEGETGILPVWGVSTWMESLSESFNLSA